MTKQSQQVVYDFGDCAEPCGEFIVIRSNCGDGGWSLHTRDQLHAARGTNEPADYLLDGDALFNAEADAWDRPNAADLATATKIATPAD